MNGRTLALLVALFGLCAAPPATAQEKTETPLWILVTAPEFEDAMKPLAEARRNDLCPCGSGLRFKHCHARLLAQVSDEL